MIHRHRSSLVRSILAGALAALAGACSAEDPLEPSSLVSESSANLRQAPPDLPSAEWSPLGPGPEAIALAPVRAGLATWGFGALGSMLGRSGIVGARNGDAVELYVGGSTVTFGENDYWYVLRSSTGTGELQPVYVSDRLPEGIRRIALARAGQGRTDIVVALFDGTVRRYNQRTKQLLSVRRDPCFARGGLLGMTTADLDGNGTDEIVSSCEDRSLFAYGTGYPRWRVAGAGSGPLPADIAVGQMDDDPAQEIATTGGFVVDSVTHAVEWQLAAGFGTQVQAIDIDADGRDELIASQEWGVVDAYDVERQLAKWSIPIFDVGATLAADIDEDGVQEILIGDGQIGGVHAFDAVTTEEEWFIDNPDSGVTQIATVDIDADGTLELVWSGGDNSTGPDHLYVTDWRTGATLSQTVHLDGPFVGPEVGDLDGDGVDEMVVASFASEADFESGRIVVIDGKQLTVRAISTGVAGGRNSFTGVHDLVLRDLNSDGRPEILVATDWLRDGVIEAYSFSASNEFTLVWTNQVRADLDEFNSVEVADIDGDGEVEVLGGGNGDFSGEGGTFVHVYDSVTGAEKAPLRLEGQFLGAIDLVVRDTDGDGAVEVAALELLGGVHVFDGASRALETTIEGQGWSLDAAESAGGVDLLVGDESGRMSIRRFDGSTYAEVVGADLSDVPIDGSTILPDGRFLVGSDDVLRAFDRPGGAETFASQPYGRRLGHRAVTLRGSPLVFSAGGYGVHGFRVPRAP
jgi:hypothetical protein